MTIFDFNNIEFIKVKYLYWEQNLIFSKLFGKFFGLEKFVPNNIFFIPKGNSHIEFEKELLKYISSKLFGNLNICCEKSPIQSN